MDETCSTHWGAGEKRKSVKSVDKILLEHMEE